MYLHDDPSKELVTNMRRWAEGAASRGFVSLYVDSYARPNGKASTYEYSTRVRDAYAGFRFLATDVRVAKSLNLSQVFLVGWSHAGVRSHQHWHTMSCHTVSRSLCCTNAQLDRGPSFANSSVCAVPCAIRAPGETSYFKYDIVDQRVIVTHPEMFTTCSLFYLKKGKPRVTHVVRLVPR